MKGEDILAIDRFYAVIPAYEPDEKMLAVIDDISSLTDFHIIVINDGRGKDTCHVCKRKSSALWN